MLTRRRRATNFLLTSHLEDEVTDGAEWTEAWRTPKRWVKPEDDELDKEEHEEVNACLVKKEDEEDKGKRNIDNEVEEEEVKNEEEGEEEKEREKNIQEKRSQNIKEICGEDEDDEEKDKTDKVYEDEEEEEEDKENEAEDDQDKDVDKKWEEEEIDEEEEETEEDIDGAEVENEEENEKEEDDKGDKVKKQIQPDVPLHLQFHKVNTSFPSWKRSWTVAVAYRGGDEGQGEEEEEEEWWAWKESWRICKSNKPDKGEVVCFSTKHRSQRFLMLEAERMLKSDWSLSWKITKTSRNLLKLKD